MAGKKGRKQITEGERRKIARARAAGKSRREIAKELGRPPDTIKHQLANPRTVTLVLAMKERLQPLIEKGFEIAVKNLVKRCADRNKEVQHQAAGMMLKYVTAGDPPLYRVGDQGTQEGDFTLDEMMVYLRRVSQSKAS